MKTIVMSDTVLLGADYEDTKKGINYLKKLQHDGYMLIILSNRPEFCMRKIGAYIPTNKGVYYRYLGACQEKGNGIDIIFHDDNQVYESINIHADYTIFGNGIKIFNRNDETVYQAPYLEQELLQNMIRNFREYGYISYGEKISLEKDLLQDRCFSGREDVYKFFTPEIGTSTICNNIYGMQCSSRSSLEDDLILERIELENPSIIGYLLNGKPCFYQRNVNKLVALEYLCNSMESVSLKDIHFILNEPTDQVILKKYPEQSIYLDDILEGHHSLVKTLDRISSR